MNNITTVNSCNDSDSNSDRFEVIDINNDSNSDSNSDRFEVIDINNDSNSDGFEVIDIDDNDSYDSYDSDSDSDNDSDTFKIINISKSFKSAKPKPKLTKSFKHRYNLRRVIKKPLRYGQYNENNRQIIYDRHNTRTIYPDFKNCTLNYNEQNGSFTIYGFHGGKEYFITRGATYRS